MLENTMKFGHYMQNSINGFLISFFQRRTILLYFTLFSVLSFMSCFYTVPEVILKTSVNDDIKIIATAESELVVSLPIPISLRENTEVVHDKAKLLSPKKKNIPVEIKPSSLQPVDWVSRFDISLIDSTLKPGKYSLKLVVQEVGRQKVYVIDFIVDRKWITIVDYIGVHD